jgi:hypothetical protein
MPELRSHKRGRSLDLRLFCNSEQRFIHANGEVEVEATTSNSEYDSDVVVVGEGRKCRRVPRTCQTPLSLGSTDLLKHEVE